MVALRLALRQALKKVCTIYYIFPTFNQARTSIFDGISIDGIRILDYIPDELCKKNASEMKVTLLNGSIIQFLGSDRYDRLRGTNPYGIVYSEYAYQHPKVFEVSSPILAANNGWAIFASTPYGKANHFYDLYQEALADPKKWYTLKLTVDDTHHISDENLAFEKKRYSEDMYLQEYFCSFDAGIEGSIYSKYIRKMKEENRIGPVHYDESQPVYTAWDLGSRRSDTTAIIFFQLIASSLHIIDCYENFRQGAAHYVKIIKSKPYVYGGHCLPHDVANFEWGSGFTRIEQLEDFGLEIHRVPRIKLKIHGIEKVRSSFGRIYIDETKCADLLKALNNYHYKWEDSRGRYNDTEPFHDWSSNYCDALMYACTGMHLLQNEFTAEDMDEIRNSAHTAAIGPRSYGNR